MEYAGGAAGAALGYLHYNLPGAWTGYNIGRYFARRRKNLYQNKSNSMAPTKRNATEVYISPPRTPKRKTINGPVTIRPVSIKKKPKRQNRTQRKTVFKVGAKRAVSKRKPLTGARGASTGTYQGKFATPASIQKSFETTGLKLGFVCGSEVTGTVEDADCVYIYHSPFHVDFTVEAICGALCRTLLRKAGIEVGNQMNELLFNTFEDSSGYTFLFTFQNLPGATSSYFVTTANDWTFQRLVNEVASLSGSGKIGYHFKDYLINNSTYKPYSMSLYVDDVRNADGSSKTTRMAAHVTLGDEYIVLKQYSCLTIQNRTKGSNAADYDADRIDNQPLKGKIYQFKNGDPRLKTQQRTGTGIAPLYEQVYSSGDVKGIRAFGSYDLGTLMLEPPEPSLWRNIDKTSNISLEPGAMKKCVLTSEYKFRLPTLMAKLKVDNYVDGVGMKAYEGLHTGTSQIIALEEQLATPSDNLIYCIYEHELKVSAYTYTKKLKGTLKANMAKGLNTQWVTPAP